MGAKKKKSESSQNSHLNQEIIQIYLCLNQTYRCSNRVQLCAECLTFETETTRATKERFENVVGVEI